MTSAEYHEVLDGCIYELGIDATVQEFLDAYSGAHILLTVVDVVASDQSKTWEQMMAYTLQQVKDGIPA